MDDLLIFEVLDRLDEARVSSTVRNLVRGALLGRLGEAADGLVIERPVSADREESAASRCYLESVAVQGFRGIGPRSELRLRPGPGLTLVVGRNGSGKSSFAEAAEFALTGSSLRWAGKSVDWKNGWRNLHSADGRLIEVELRVEGEREHRTVRVRWTSDKLESAETVVTIPGRGRHSLESLGWNTAVKTFRPFLPYKELSSISEGRPIDRYRALMPMLGMEHLQASVEELRQARLRSVKQSDAAKTSVAEMREVLLSSPDQRAAIAASALAGSWDLATIEDLIRGIEPAAAERERLLAALEEIPAPDLDQVAAAASNLRTSEQCLDALRDSDAGRARRLAGLLEAAVDMHERHGDADCPVCGSKNVLHDARVAELRGEVANLRSEAAAVEAAVEAASATRLAARGAIGVVPQVLELEDSVDVGVELSELRGAWRDWVDAPDADAELAAHLDSACLPLLEATEAVRNAASAVRQRLADQWRPIARQLVEMLPIARAGQSVQRQVPQLKDAENWLKKCAEAVRDERFDAVKEQVKDVWDMLAVDSNVTLEDVRFGTKRVDMDVTVDGDEGAALGVMSQGELNTLALSLFIPRVRSEASPFRFAMLDDPVQAMDPVRVDGLARVLHRLAQTHQVVVLTHDERLASAIRRLQIAATIVSVTRRPKSVVELRTLLDPVEATIDEARALVFSNEIPDEVPRRVVPGLCRQAIEAACLELGWRRLLATGITVTECEALWAAADRLLTRVAIALYGDADRAGDVYRTLNNKFGGWAADTVRDCNEMTHSGAPDGTDLKDLITRSESLAARLTAR